MRPRIYILPVFSLICAGSAFAGAALPSVNVSRSVSARAMYGEAPVVDSFATQKTPEVITQTESPKITKSISAGDVLSPRRPNENLWTQSKDAPLRMPRNDEFAMLDDTAPLPEESLDSQSDKVELRIPVAIRPSKKVVEKIAEKSVDDDVVAKAYDAGRIAELQRIADNALTSRAVESKTRKLVVSMDDDAPRAAVASVRSTKASPMVEEEFAYKNPDDMPLTKLSPMQLKRAFKKTYVSENKHLSAYRVEDKFDTASDEETNTTIQGFDSTPDLSERSDIRPLEIKISFQDSDSALSRDNYMLLTEYAGIVVSNPKRAIQVSIPEHATRSFDGRKLAAKRLAIIEQVLRDTGVPDQKVMPVLADRTDESLVLRVISNDTFQSLTQQIDKKSKTTKSLAW